MIQILRRFNSSPSGFYFGDICLAFKAQNKSNFRIPATVFTCALTTVFSIFIVSISLFNIGIHISSFNELYALCEKTNLHLNLNVKFILYQKNDLARHMIEMILLIISWIRIEFPRITFLNLTGTLFFSECLLVCLFFCPKFLEQPRELNLVIFHSLCPNLVFTLTAGNISR